MTYTEIKAYTEEEKKAYQTIKEELKALAKSIKILKPQHKINQREYSLYTHENGSTSDYFGRKMTSGQFEIIRTEYNKKWSKQSDSALDLARMRDKFRIKHIMCCLARGTNYNRIEPNPRDDDHYHDIMSRLEELEESNKILSNTLKYKRSKQNLN